MMVKLPLSILLLWIHGWSFGQGDCTDLVKVQFISLDDSVHPDSGQVRDVLRPEQPMRRRDQPGFEYALPSNPSRQVLQLMDGFNDAVRIFVDDSLLFEGKAMTDPSLSVANVEVDLGERFPDAPKRLRIVYRDRCIVVDLDGAYPIVLVYRMGIWCVNYSDYWPMVE